MIRQPPSSTRTDSPFPYTTRFRSVPLDGGVRLSGKIGATTNVGFLRMSSERVEDLAPANDFTVARVSQELKNRSGVGALFVERSGDGSLSGDRSEEHTAELQSLMRISSAVFCLKKKNTIDPP